MAAVNCVDISQTQKVSRYPHTKKGAVCKIGGLLWAMRCLKLLILKGRGESEQVPEFRTLFG
jgi:hypothetical protein